jgi:hypothetical protein
MADEPDDGARRRAEEIGERTVIGGAPVQGGPTMVSSGAFDTPAGGDLGGPGARDFGDSADRLSPETSADLTRGLPTRAEEVFGSDEDTNDDQINAALDGGKNRGG